MNTSHEEDENVHCKVVYLSKIYKVMIKSSHPIPTDSVQPISHIHLIIRLDRVPLHLQLRRPHTPRAIRIRRMKRNMSSILRSISTTRRNKAIVSTLPQRIRASNIRSRNLIRKRILRVICRVRVTSTREKKHVLPIRRFG